MSDFFTAAELDELQDVAESAMAGTMVIRRQALAANGQGGYSTTYPVVGTVSCHIWRNRYANEKTVGAQVKSIADWYVAVPVGTDIRETTDWGVVGTVTLQITHVPAQVTWNPHLRCEAVSYNRELKDDEV